MKTFEIGDQVVPTKIWRGVAPSGKVDKIERTDWGGMQTLRVKGHPGTWLAYVFTKRKPKPPRKPKPGY